MSVKVDVAGALLLAAGVLWICPKTGVEDLIG